MGLYNRITKEKFNKIKKDCGMPADDPFVMEKHGIGKTTVRLIRNSANYQEYCERVFRYHGHPKGRGGSVMTKEMPPIYEPIMSTNANKPQLIIVGHSTRRHSGLGLLILVGVTVAATVLIMKLLGA